MTLKPGVLIGPYRVESLVGDNGFGDVWKARDVLTGRATALRILPAAPPCDPERLARFDRDTRVLASLNHPHLPKTYGIVEVGDIRALAVEWVNGSSLAERMRRGPLALAEAMFFSVQVADAVGAAHDRAVVHGNLQPCNIKVSSDLSVKVLDVGLHTLFEPEISHPSNVLPSPLARAVSVIIGTASYMSPEQVRGAHVDARADVWAFGCVLFEMLTGRPAFGATDATETFELVLHADPEWTWIPASTPAALVLMLKTCLKKDATARRQNLSGASIELRDTMKQQGAHEAVIRDSVLEHGFDSFLEQQIPSLKRWVKGHVPRSLDLDEEDIVQQAVASARRRAQDLGSRSEGALRAYLRQAVMNQILDELRRKGRRGTTPPDEDDEAFPDDASELGPDVTKGYGAALEQLSEHDRELILARLEQEMSYDDIATRLSLPSSAAARMSVTRAIKRLIEKIKDLFRK